MIYFYWSLLAFMFILFFWILVIRKHKLTSFAGQWWKMYSSWSSIIGTTLISLSTIDPQSMFNIWNSIPPDIKSFIPPKFVQLIGISLVMISFVSGFIRQKKLTESVKMKEMEKKENE